MHRVHVRRASLWFVGAGVAVAGCSSGPDVAATVLVDYDHDEFATQFLRFFPEHVRVHPGDTVAFKQAWTGEPHTVTFGTSVDEVLAVTRPLLADYGHLPQSEVPLEVLEEFYGAEMTLPRWFTPPPDEGTSDGATGGEAAPDDVPAGPPTVSDTLVETPPLPQALAQPCVVREGELPEDTSGPCEDQELTPFEGTEVYYNSGVIPYEGPAGNQFVFEVSDTIAPGTYGYYCAVHGSIQSGVIEVVPADEPVDGPEQVASALRSEITTTLQPYSAVFAGAARGEYSWKGDDHGWNYAGLLTDDSAFSGIINEFVPETVTAAVNEPVTWRMFGPHSISFDVPEYFPIVEFLEDGTVRSNEAIYTAAGGAPEVVPPEDPSVPIVVDGGTWDGSGYWSSGVLHSEAYVEYTLRVSEPGSYPFACLIHPPMVGTLQITAPP